MLQNDSLFLGATSFPPELEVIVLLLQTTSAPSLGTFEAVVVKVMENPALLAYQPPVHFSPFS